MSVFLWSPEGELTVEGLAQAMSLAGHLEVTVDGELVAMVPFEPVSEAFYEEWVGRIEAHFGCRYVGAL